MNEQKLRTIVWELEDDIKNNQEVVEYFQEKLKKASKIPYSRHTDEILSYREVYKKEAADVNRYGSCSIETMAVVCMEAAVRQEKEEIIDRLYDIVFSKDSKSPDSKVEELLNYIGELEKSV
jgi:hypothetical protein